ncbi:hypothetical protein ABBQ32_003790 [Trebouxia sp. C0010 RCD-2024]
MAVDKFEFEFKFARMYAVKVNVRQSPEDVELSEEASRLATELLAEQSLDTARSSDHIQDEVSFSAGNPRVEHVTGKVHLYRQVSSDPLNHQLPTDRSERLCVLAMPLDMGMAEFCSFVGAYLPKLREMRIVRREDGKSVCLILLRFDSLETADSFFHNFHDKPFSSLEPDVLCRLVYVKEVEFTTQQDNVNLPAPPGQTELPTCPVCLERLDEHISGVVTTVCNHRFHNECLQRWGDLKCPVCRYCAQASSITSHCSVCDTSQDLWICLICGQVGCGRGTAKHAVDHWKESGHCYSLELESQRVWDYASDGYVHRLVQSKTDGKLVEVPSPAQAACGEHLSTAGPEGPRSSAEDAALGEAMVASKREEMDREIDHLLITQSENLRRYWEGRVSDAHLRGEAACAKLQDKLDISGAALQTAASQHKELDKQKRAADKKLAELAVKLSKLQKEKDFLQQTSESLLRNQDDFRTQLLAEQTKSQAKDAQITDLTEQVRDLMVYLEAQQHVQASGEMAHGTVLPVPEPAPGPKRKGSRGRGRQ